MSICQECHEDRMAFYKKQQIKFKNAERVALTALHIVNYITGIWVISAGESCVCTPLSDPPQ